jgi:hypothetical protein
MRPVVHAIAAEPTITTTLLLRSKSADEYRKHDRFVAEELKRMMKRTRETLPAPPATTADEDIILSSPPVFIRPAPEPLVVNVLPARTTSNDDAAKIAANLRRKAAAQNNKNDDDDQSSIVYVPAQLPFGSL